MLLRFDSLRYHAKVEVLRQGHNPGANAAAEAAEVFGDYGSGPNHVLPTSGTARFASGLSVFTFLNVRTFLWSADGVDSDIVREAAAFARLEGLEAHRQAALARAPGLTQP